jgi:molecular chaperone GrpE
MIDRQILTEQLLDYIQAIPDLPDYLEQEPEVSGPFDPYQIVAEWTALRQEIKQQNKLFLATQSDLQKALDIERSRNENLEAQLAELATLATQSPPGSQANPSADADNLKDLLSLGDAFDQAIAHIQSQIDDIGHDIGQPTPTEADTQPLQPSTTSAQLPGFWQKFLSAFREDPPIETAPPGPQLVASEALIPMLTSNQEGLEMIRRSLLTILQKQQVQPILALGQPFDPTCMYAIDQKPTDSQAPNTVIQEVRRGYLQGDRILREAQVIVARKLAL